MEQQSDNAPLLSASVILPNSTLWFGTIELFQDCISVSGWQWTGSVQRRIPLTQIQKIEVRSAPTGPNFIVYPERGNRLAFRIKKGIGHWRLRLDSCDKVEVSYLT